MLTPVYHPDYLEVVSITQTQRINNMINITLQQIKDAHPCENGWKKVLKAHGGLNADLNKPFQLSSILDSNNLDDTLWVISNVSELSEYDHLWRKFAKWCALQNITKIIPYCSDENYKLIVEYLESEKEELRESAWSAARSAAWSAARSVAESPQSAVWAAQSAAWAAAESAAESARSAAWAAQSDQENKLRELID